MSPNRILRSGRLVAAVALACSTAAALAQSTRQLPEVKLNRDGTPKQFRLTSRGKWYKAEKLASDENTTLYIARTEEKHDNPNDFVNIRSWGNYSAVIFAFFKDRNTCVQSAGESDALKAQCDTQLYRLERVSVEPLKQKAWVVPVSSAPGSEPRPSYKGQRPSGAFSSYSPLYVQAFDHLNEIAGKIYPEALQPEPPGVCDLASGKPVLKLDDPEIRSTVSEPKLLHKADPDYTEEARRRRVNGEVVLQLVISEQGTPTCMRVIKHLRYGLTEQAIAAVQQWRFKPAMENGEPVPIELNVSVSFQIF